MACLSAHRGIAKLCGGDWGGQMGLVTNGFVRYTLGPALRTLHVKNLGTDLAPERLRTCPWLGVHHRYRPHRGRRVRRPALQLCRGKKTSCQLVPLRRQSVVHVHVHVTHLTQHRHRSLPLQALMCIGAHRAAKRYFHTSNELFTPQTSLCPGPPGPKNLPTQHCRGLRTWAEVKSLCS